MATGKILRRIPLPADLLPNELHADAIPEMAWAGRAGSGVIMLAWRPRPQPYGLMRAFVVTSRGVTRIPLVSWIGELTGDQSASW